MNWNLQLQKLERPGVAAVLLVSAATMLVTLLRNPIALDSFWHLRMGMDWIGNGLSPWIDHYSFTYQGHPITNPPVAFQALLHVLVSQFGVRMGFVLVKLSAYVLVLGAVVYLLRQQRAPAVLYAMVLPVLVFLLQMRSIVRPELFSFAFSVFALILYMRAENKVSARAFLPIVFLMLAWTNYHSSIVGYIIFAGLFLDCAVEQYRKAAPPIIWAQWLAWGLLVLLVGFVNPGWSHPLIEAVTFPDEWKYLIDEYLPPFAFNKTNPGIYLLALLTLLVPVLAVRHRRFGFLLIWLVLAYTGVTMQRMVTPAGIVIVLMLALLLVKDWPPWKRGFAGHLGDKVAGSFFLLIVGVALYANVERALGFLKENQSTYTRYPEAMVNYMLREGIHGRIFNDYGIGGYLIYRLAPDIQVYIDGRTQILYPIEHMLTYEEAKKVPNALQNELDEYQFDLMVRRFTQGFHSVVMELGEFELDFVDSYYALYRRGAGNFRVMGRLISRPACWRPGVHPELESERRKMDAILPRYSKLIPFADFVTEYGRAADGRAYLDQSISQDEWTDEMRRFAAYRFFEAGEHDVARLLFAGITFRKPEDFLAPAMGMVLSQEWELASQILEDMTRVNWAWMSPGDVLAYHALLSRLDDYRALSTAEQALHRRLQIRLDELGMPGREMEWSSAAFCPSP